MKLTRGGSWSLILVVLLACAGGYAVRLRAENHALLTRLPVQAEVDFSAMVIVTRPVAPATSGAPRIKAWERCALGAARCLQRPRSVEARCQAGVVEINEADWSALQRIPAEDLAGVEHPSSYQSMKLCDQ